MSVGKPVHLPQLQRWVSLDLGSISTAVQWWIHCCCFPWASRVCTPSWVCGDKNEIYSHCLVVCFPLILLVFFPLFSVTNPCFQSSLSLPWIYWGSRRERWNEVIYFVCRCLAVNWVFVAPLLILWHVAVPGWVLLCSLCLVELLNIFLWVAIHPKTGKCAFSKFSCFLSFQIFQTSPPCISLYFWELSRAGIELYLCWHN